jgi:hypothetical protein
MSAHKILFELNEASKGNGKVLVVIPPTATVPSGVAGFAKGCILIKPGDAAYTNTASLSSCTFEKIDSTVV